MVSTLDFESSDPSSNLGRTFFHIFAGGIKIGIQIVVASPFAPMAHWEKVHILQGAVS